MATDEYDVFLSHSTKDKDVVEELERKLKDDGFRVWCNKVQGGEHVLMAINAGLEKSRVFACCLSKSSLESDWVQLELSAVLHDDPLNKRGRIVLLQLDDAPLPQILRPFHRIDWRPEVREAMYARLHNLLRHGVPPAALFGSSPSGTPTPPQDRGPKDGYKLRKELGRGQADLAEAVLRAQIDLDEARREFESGLARMYGFSLQYAAQWRNRDSIEDPLAAAAQFRGYGDALRKQGASDDALAVYGIAESLLNNSDADVVVERGKLYSSFAECHLRRFVPDLEQAADYARRSLDLHASRHNAFEQFQSARIFADVRLAQGNPEAAEALLAQADAFWHAANVDLARRKLLGWLHRTRGDLELARERNAAARAEYKLALDLFDHADDLIGIAIMHAKLGKVAEGDGNPAAAEKEYQTALTVIAAVPGAEYIRDRILLTRLALGRIGAASSVSRDGHRFDALAAVEYVVERKFAVLQLYLDDELVTDEELRRKMKSRVRAANLPLMLHAPGLLRMDQATEPAVIAAALDLLQHEPAPRMVFHFDEQESVENSLATVEAICAAGIIPCVENYHQLKGEANARRNYDLYLELWERIRARSLPAVPVIDIPRLFHAPLELSLEAAADLTVQVFLKLAALKFPVLLHLMDSISRMQERETWVPLGRGIIPYVDIFQRVAGKVRWDDVILEFEDASNPLPSRDFLNGFRVQ